MRELQNTEILQVHGGSWGMLGLGLFSGLTTGFGFAALPMAAEYSAFAIITSSTVITVIIAMI